LLLLDLARRRQAVQKTGEDSNKKLKIRMLVTQLRNENNDFMHSAPEYVYYYFCKAVELKHRDLLIFMAINDDI